MTPAPVRVVPVRGARALRLFIDIAYRLHACDSLWVPPPRRDVAQLLDTDRHPFHEHARVDYFLAFRGRRCVGRIAAIENFLHNTYHNERIGFFGFLDAEPEAEVFAALLDAAGQWARRRGLTALRGPASFSTNEEVGLLVHGFTNPPFLMTPWNPESYPALVEAAGYTRARDLLTWWVSTHSYNPRMDRLADKVVQRLERQGHKVTARRIDMTRFDEELALVRRIYNAAWAGNWGFVPMTESEVRHMARALRPVLLPQLVHFIEIDNTPAGFALALPDYNLILRHLRGRTGPLEIGIFLLLRRRLHQLRVLAMGVVPEFRNRGIETLLVSRVVRHGIESRFETAELGWILEDNDAMNRELAAMGAVHYRTHRLYEKALDTPAAPPGT